MLSPGPAVSHICRHTSRPSMVSVRVKKSGPIVALYRLEKAFRTNRFTTDVFPWKKECYGCIKFQRKEIIPTPESPRMIIFSSILLRGGFSGRINENLIACSVNERFTCCHHLTEFKPGRCYPRGEGDQPKVSSNWDLVLPLLQFDCKSFPQPFVWSDSIHFFTNQAHDSGRFDPSQNQNMKPNLDG